MGGGGGAGVLESAQNYLGPYFEKTPPPPPPGNRMVVPYVSTPRIYYGYAVNNAVQNQKLVTALSPSKQLQPFNFAKQCRVHAKQ